MNSKKVIILLHTPHEPNIKKLQESLLSYCKDNNFTIIKIIIANHEYNCQVLSKLIKLINSENDPVHLIISDNSFNEISYIFTYTVIATLLDAKLINSLYIYQNERSQTTSAQGKGKTSASSEEKIIEVKQSLLPFCARYYEAIVVINRNLL
jgi:hypothetical protein